MHANIVQEVLGDWVCVVCVSPMISFTTHIEPECQLSSLATIVCDISWITIGITPDDGCATRACKET